MKQRTPAQRRLLLAAFSALLLFLALLLRQGIRRGDAVRVGVPRSAEAIGAAMLLQTPSAQYRCVLGSTAQALAAALRSGDIDAALLPRDIAQSVPGCRVEAVIGYETAVVMTRRPGLESWTDLTGQTLTLPETMAGSGAEDMLRRRLQSSHVRAGIAYGAPADPYLCGLDEAAALIAADGSWRVAFSLSRQWSKWLPDPPPAGLCLTVSENYLSGAGGDYDAFLRALRSSLRYGAEKRKKTVAMAAAAGLTPGGEDTADKIYPRIDFIWLTGEDMRAALSLP